MENKSRRKPGRPSKRDKLMKNTHKEDYTKKDTPKEKTKSEEVSTKSTEHKCESRNILIYNCDCWCNTGVGMVINAIVCVGGCWAVVDLCFRLYDYFRYLPE